jgi:hypothetical protein
MRNYLRMNWDYWLIVALALLFALTVGAWLGAVDDTIRHIRLGY